MFGSISKFAIILIVGVAAIAVILGLTLGIVLNQCTTVVAPQNLKITSSEPRYIRLSWTNSEENGDCSATYMISYKVNQGQEFEATTTREYYAFTTLDLCFDLVVNVWAISQTGKKSEGSATASYNSYPIAPNDIPEPLGDIFTSTDRGLELTWPKARELDNCDVHYKIRIVTDKTEIPETTVDSESITIEDDQYCFLVDVYITTVIRESVSPEFARHYIGILEPPQDIRFTTSATEHTITFTWSEHPKQSYCDIEYMVRYSLPNSEQITRTTLETTMAFHTAYCNVATFVFTTISGGRESHGHSWIRRENLPEFVGPVQNIRIDLITEDTVLVLWNSPAYVEACTDIIYTVTAENEDTYETNTCNGYQSCEIILDVICPVTNFRVQATSIKGEESMKRYECINEK